MFLIWICASAASCYYAAFLSRSLGMPSIVDISRFFISDNFIQKDMNLVFISIARGVTPVSP